MPINSQHKEKYRTLKVQVDMVREKSIACTIGEGNSVRVMNMPRSAISYASQRGFGRIMTFPVIQHLEIAEWLCKKEGL